MASKLAKKWTLENVFPHFMVFSTKSYLVIHDFAIHGFFFPPNTRELRGPPVIVLMLMFGHFDDEISIDLFALYFNQTKVCI